MEQIEELKIINNKKSAFKLNYSFSYIKIKRIVITSLLGVDSSLWMNHLSSFNLIFSYSDKRGASKTFPMNLLAYISPYHRQPVIEFPNLLIPEENVKNITSLGNYYTDLKIYIEPIGTNSIDKPQLEIYYESSPGVVISND